jgi:hypothetical protein
MIDLSTVKFFKRCGSISKVRKEDEPMQMSTKIKLEVLPCDAATLEFMQTKCWGLYNCGSGPTHVPNADS